MVIYLLHFSSPIVHASHYMGITQDERLAIRLREHQRGHGASLTRRAGQLNVTFRLVWTLHGVTWRDEHKMKRRSHFRKLCPICRGLSTPDHFEAYAPLWRANEDGSKWRAFDWS